MIHSSKILILSSPFSVQSTHKSKLAEDGKESTTHRRMVLENGHPGVEVNEAAIRKGESPYTKYYQQQGEHPALGAASNGQSAAPLRFPA
jgi:pre-mRNA-processing factor 39